MLGPMDFLSSSALLRLCSEAVDFFSRSKDLGWLAVGKSLGPGNGSEQTE